MPRVTISRFFTTPLSSHLWRDAGFQGGGVYPSPDAVTISHAVFLFAGMQGPKGVGSILVWMPTDKVSEDDSEFVHVCVCALSDVIMWSCDPVDAYLAIAKDKFGYGAEQVNKIQFLIRIAITCLSLVS